MKRTFPGFQPEAMRFLKSLAKNNDREWFQPRKEQFDELWKEPMIALMGALNEDLKKFAPEYVRDPAKAVHRIYRDTRFSKDKTPYKTNVSAVVRRNGLSKDGGAQFYFQISPKGVMLAAGTYAPNPDELRALRQYLAEHQEEFERLASAPKLKAALGELQGERLTRPPKGFPDLDLLRHKQFYFSKELDGEVAATPELFTNLVKSLRASMPVMEFLNRPLLGLAKSDDSRFVSDGLSL